MRLAVDAVLAQRSRLVRADTRASIGGSLVVHVLLVGSCAVVPLLATSRSETLPEFVPVYLVPAQALGISEPTPAASRTPPSPPQLEPAPETAPPPSEKEPEPEPAMPSPEPQRRPPKPSPPPVASRSQSELGRRQGSPTGSTTGTSAFGGALSFADQNFTYSYYIDQMLAMIEAQWDRPALGGQVEAALFFRIRRDGKITDLRIVDSSGFNVFDLAGLRAVRQATPFPRLPVSYPRRVLAVKLILR